MSFGMTFKDGATAVAAMNACDCAGARFGSVRNYGSGSNRLDICDIEKESPEMAREIIDILHAYGGEED